MAKDTIQFRFGSLNTTPAPGTIHSFRVRVKLLSPQGPAGADGAPGVGTATPDLFLAPINARTGVNLGATLTNQLSITDANILINRGGYTIENDLGSLQQIVIPADGTYTLKSSLLVELTTASATSIRDHIEIAIVVLRAAAVLRTASSSNHMRGNLLQPTYTTISYTDDELGCGAANFRDASPIKQPYRNC